MLGVAVLVLVEGGVGVGEVPELPPAVITNVTMDLAGTLPLTMPPLTVTLKVPILLLELLVTNAVAELAVAPVKETETVSAEAPLLITWTEIAPLVFLKALVSKVEVLPVVPRRIAPGWT